jgi:hypothetical protein
MLFLVKLIGRKMTKYIQLLSDGSVNFTILSTKPFKQFKVYDKDHKNFFLNKKKSLNSTKTSYQSAEYIKQYLKF